MIEISSLMTKEVKTIPKDMPLPEAVVYLSTLGMSSLPVVDGNGKLIGIFSEKNLLSDPAYMHLRTLIKLFSEMEYYKKDDMDVQDQLKDIIKLKVKDLMNSNPPTLHPEDDIESAKELFYSLNINDPIPVVDQNNKLKGILAISDLTKFYGGIPGNQIAEKDVTRDIDRFVDQFEKEFIIVSRFRAKTWLISGVVLMLAGFSIAFLLILHISRK
jgi:CBS domain-containing protein